MYNDHFGLQDNPFSIAPDPRFLFMSEWHREALAHLLYGIRHDGGFILLTGEVGTGKTTVCRCLLEQLPADTRVAYVINPRLSTLELLATICDEFGIDYPPGNTGNKLFIDRLNAFLLESHAAGRRNVLIIDEAQNLSADVLEQLRLLTNLETNRRKLLQIVLLGQPELRTHLSRPELRQLAQRVTARYHLEPLAEREVAAYVNHRLAVAGSRRPLFPNRLIRQIYRLSGGIPRRINILCDRALLGAYVQGRERVTARLLTRAAREVRDGAPRRHAPWNWAAGLLLIGGLALFLPSFLERGTAPEQAPATAAPLPPPAPAAVPEPFSTQLDLPAGAGSEESAYQAVLAAWGLAFQPAEQGGACRYAESFGLSCLFRRGSLGSLRLLNRPAVLTLTGAPGTQFHAALMTLSDESASIVLEGKKLTIPLRELQRRWLGEFSVVWRRPPFAGILRPGDRGPGVVWLERQLAALRGEPAKDRPGMALAGDLLEHLREFQRARGLAPDGVVGPNTLIHLDSALGGSSPQLIELPEDR